MWPRGIGVLLYFPGRRRRAQLVFVLLEKMLHWNRLREEVKDEARYSLKRDHFSLPLCGDFRFLKNCGELWFLVISVIIWHLLFLHRELCLSKRPPKKPSVVLNTGY